MHCRKKPRLYWRGLHLQFSHFYRLITVYSDKIIFQFYNVETNKERKKKVFPNQTFLPGNVENVLKQHLDICVGK